MMTMMTMMICLQILDNEAEVMVDGLTEEEMSTSILGAFDEAMKEELACLGCTEDLLNAFVDKKTIQACESSVELETSNVTKKKKIVKQSKVYLCCNGCFRTVIAIVIF